jgi:hypothetical protein
VLAFRFEGWHTKLNKMHVNKSKAINNVEVLNKLFLIGDVIYHTEPIHLMNGKFDYATKVFDSDKNYLGLIRSSNFPDNAFERLENES